jgi:hypothetical protein
VARLFDREFEELVKAPEQAWARQIEENPQVEEFEALRD